MVAANPAAATIRNDMALLEEERPVGTLKEIDGRAWRRWTAAS